jgi:hypothetical protein
MRFRADTITFNGIMCTGFEITPSAQKHWGEMSEPIYRHIFDSLNGMTLKPESEGEDGAPLFHVASVTSVEIVPQMIRPRRDTVFAMYVIEVVQPSEALPEGTIRFIHGCPREESWYQRWVQRATSD